MVKPNILMISQVFPPDPASVGQHLSDVADELARRGSRIVVLTADRGYNDPSQRYERRQTIGDVSVVRFRFSSFGKRTLLHRVVSGVAFSAQALLHGLFAPRLRVVVATTVPPMAGIVGAVISIVKRVPLIYWVMDLNPDQVVALGKLSPSSTFVRLLRWANRIVFARASDVVVLDRFMRDRVRQYDSGRCSIHVVPPWPLDEVVARLPHAENPFRAAHQLTGQFVVMYSGNLGLHALDTLLDAAAELEHDADLLFLFVGGGVAKEAIERRGLQNVKTLPYQPRSALRESLSAADLHIVALGNEAVGINHPCKIYGAMAVGRPIVYLGPKESHIGDILAEQDIGWQVDHGDVAGLKAAIAEARRLSLSLIHI